MVFNNEFIAVCFVNYGFALLNQNKSYLQGATEIIFRLKTK